MTRVTKALMRVQHSEAGMSTAEYAIGTIAAASFGGILWKLLTSPFILQLLEAIFQKALSWLF
jgi:Protein of unknown function (DUF4244)